MIYHYESVYFQKNPNINYDHLLIEMTNNQNSDKVSGFLFPFTLIILTVSIYLRRTIKGGLFE
ncbi:MAG: hypothetical protein HeimC3_30020 [Candidatus Heimdallarchaeota archaeon LC_3]|nr:MAG: hypothetical protein HeimC3_30020 [Candidatus Heimdallarchaeota archaeon LC_3]